MNEIDIELPIQKLISLRQHIHQLPETAGKEFKTANRVKQFISTLPGWEIREGVGDTGLVALYHCRKPGKTALFRAELDGLPQRDCSEKPWKSQNTGAAHACGHDGHMTILMGLASAISLYQPAAGTFLLLFQPAEENGAGAEKCIHHPVFVEFPPDLVFSFHNIPGQPLDRVIIKDGSFSASVKSVMIHLHGKASHAAEPEHGINPSFYISDLLSFCMTRQITDPTREDFYLITPTFIHAGEPAHGTAASEGEINLTFRTWNEPLMERNIQLFLMQLSALGKLHKVRTSIKFTDIFPATNNDHQAAELIRKAARNNHLEITEASQPFRWGEDFGVFTRQYKGAMFGIGSGENCPPLHSVDYDFPDELIETTVRLMLGIINIL